MECLFGQRREDIFVSKANKPPVNVKMTKIRLLKKTGHVGFLRSADDCWNLRLRLKCVKTISGGLYA